MRVLCPFCLEDTVECADLVPCTQPVYEWEIGPGGLPVPSDYGMSEPCWEASEPEDPAKPYVCPPCYKYLSADMLIVEQEGEPPLSCNDCDGAPATPFSNYCARCGGGGTSNV